MNATPWLRAAEAAAYGCLSRGQFFDACAERKLEHIRIGGRRTIVTRREWIDAYLESLRVHVQPAGGAR